MDAKKICYFIFGLHSIIGMLAFVTMILVFHAITIPEENRVYTIAKIVEIKEEDDNYTVKAIITYNKEEEKTVELDFYDSRMKKGDTIEVYYDKDNPSNIGSEMMDDVYPYFYLIPGFFIVEGSIGVIATYLISKKKENV